MIFLKCAIIYFFSVQGVYQSMFFFIPDNNLRVSKHCKKFVIIFISNNHNYQLIQKHSLPIMSLQQWEMILLAHL